MADNSGKIKYTDLFADDVTTGIEYLTLQLEDITKQFGVMTNAVRANAIKIVGALKQVSSASTEGKQAIDESAIAASRLERAQKELAFAMTDTGKQVAWLKERTKEFNSSSINQQRIITSLDGSYNKLKAELKDNIALWQALSQAERNDATIGGAVLSNILSIKDKLNGLNEQMKVQVTTMTELEKAQQKLNYLRSEEGQKLIAVRKEIQAVLAGEKQQKQTVDQLTAAQEKLQAALSSENIALKQINNEIQQANRVAALTAKFNASAEGSYDRLAAQYELNKIKLNAMSTAERSATAEGKKLEAETLALYKRMIVLQESTGNHRLSVGEYARSWDGLGNAMNQIIREMPSMAVSLNTFFLAISNNVPILIDEIERVKEKNKALIAEGRPTKNVMKTIVSSIFSWQTALIVLITALAQNGEAIINWVKNLIQGGRQAKDMKEIVGSVVDELEKTTGGYGDNVVALKRLSAEWAQLGGKLSKQKQFIKDNKSEFDKLNVSIGNVSDAENLLVKNTEFVTKALKLRAKAAAAMKLATEQYEKSLQAQAKADKATSEGPSLGDKAISLFAQSSLGIGGLIGDAITEKLTGRKLDKSVEAVYNTRINLLKSEAKAAEADADAYFKLGESYESEYRKALKSIGLDTAHKKTDKERQKKDLTDQVWKNELSIRKKYEASITELLRDEFRKRKQESIDSAEATIRELREKFRQNEAFLAGKAGTKALTAEQKEQIQLQQKMLLATIENTEKQLHDVVADINAEEAIDSMQVVRQNMQFRYDALAEELEKEKMLKLQNVDDKFSRAIIAPSTIETTGKSQTGSAGVTVLANKPTERQSALYHSERLKVEAEYDEKILNIRKQFIDNALELTKSGSAKQLAYQIQQNDIERDIEIAKNKQKNIEERQSEDDIIKKYNKKALSILGNYYISRQEQRSEFNKSELEATKASSVEIQKAELEGERDMWNLKISLAEAGALDWSELQIKAAENTVKAINEKIKKLSGGSGLIARIGQYGILGALFSYTPGADDDAINSFNEACNNIISNLQEIAQAEVDVAQAAVDAAEKRVEAAQSAYEGEMEARANGYANNVATAKKELQQEKKKQQEKQKLLEAAQRRQEAINTVMQASSLITAAANIWQSLSAIPIVGPALAIAMIATMFTSFAVAKVKARQATDTAESTYGEGGLEFLEGGSHASGNDIDLHTKNKDGKNMRAEGGEALAVINRRNTRKYKKVLPEVIKSLNNGVFEDKFSAAFSSGDTIQRSLIQVNNRTDLSRIEKSLLEIKEQREHQVIVLNDGRVLVVKGNVRTVINR